MTTTTDETTHLRELLAEQTARAERAEATASRLDAVVRAYPNATTDLAQWAKPTIALIDAGALQAISPVEDEDADGGTPWPGQCIGALVNGFLDLASDVGKHNGDADRLVHNAVDELRNVARELRVTWTDRDMAICALTKCGVALDVHSSSSLVSHAKAACRQVHDLLYGRNAALAALAANAEMRAALKHANEMEAFVCDTPDTVEHASGETEEEPCGECIDCRAHALLSRPDLGAGMVVVPREVVERVHAAWAADRAMADLLSDDLRIYHQQADVLANHDAWRVRRRSVIDDLDALLKKGGG